MAFKDPDAYRAYMREYMRKRRANEVSVKPPDYQGKEPTKKEFRAWVDTYLTWNVTRRKTARQVIFNLLDHEGPVGPAT